MIFITLKYISTSSLGCLAGMPLNNDSELSNIISIKITQINKFLKKIFIYDKYFTICT